MSDVLQLTTDVPATDVAAERTRVLVYRLGSIGDFVVALPCFHLIRRHYPGARIGLLTNLPVGPRAASAKSLLEGSGLVDDYVAYPVHTRRPSEVAAVRRAIRQFDPDVFIYLMGSRGRTILWRDHLFFRWCGVHDMIGVPFSPDLRESRPPAPGTSLWESEAHRLSRCLTAIGDTDIGLAANWDLHLTADELDEGARRIAREVSAPPEGLRLIGLSIGTKQPIKDWGDKNWRAVLAELGRPDLGLVLIGAQEERVRSRLLAEGWPGPVLNFCGRLSPRLSAAVIRRTEVFLCHDSGPMHLAAAVGTRCVAVFGNNKPPGQWFPFGSRHTVLFPPPDAGSIAAIRPVEVAAAARRLLDRG